MRTEIQSAHPIIGERTSFSRVRKDSTSPGGTAQDKRRFSQEDRFKVTDSIREKEQRGRSRSRNRSVEPKETTAATSTNSDQMAEVDAKAEEEVEVQQHDSIDEDEEVEHVSIKDSEDERVTDTFEDAHDATSNTDTTTTVGSFIADTPISAIVAESTASVDTTTAAKVEGAETITSETPAAVDHTLAADRPASSSSSSSSSSGQHSGDMSNEVVEMHPEDHSSLKHSSIISTTSLSHDIDDTATAPAHSMAAELNDEKEEELEDNEGQEQDPKKESEQDQVLKDELSTEHEEQHHEDDRDDDFSEIGHSIQEDIHSSPQHISTASMDNVSLGDVNDLTHTRTKTLESIPDVPPPVPARNSVPSVDSVKGLSGTLPSVNFPPPPPPPETKSTLAHPPPPTRKVSSPFAWFSRATSRNTKPPSPSRPEHVRSDTASSSLTLGSNTDAIDVRDKSPARLPQRESLRDRFQHLRLQEEMATFTALQDSPELPERGRSGSMHTTDGETKSSLSPPQVVRSNSFSVLPTPTGIKLPPGTAAGSSAGPSEEPSQVDWDLWQSVVYEGPAAVTRTSGEELNRAIANGIPQPIRGVVWQVLADSKNADLESMYKDLVARGTDKDTGRPLPVQRSISTSAINERDSMASSASSIKSDVSTPPTAVSPALSQDHNEPPFDKKRRSIDDKAAIQRLEKVIRRDLGARTSYSKYLASAGLQEGLFGLCKAYALFDEAVGYAQGMNFIAMPLLFNMPEEEAFTLFVRLMSKYNLRSMFTAELTGLHLHLYQFERLLEDFEPALYCHLHRRGVSPNLYATQWFLTLFAYRFPLQLVLRVYDLILSEGLSAILKFGIALMQKNAHTLLAIKDMSQLATYLKEKLFDVYIDKAPSASSIMESGFFGSAGGIDKEIYRADELVRDACAVSVSEKTLAAYAAEFEEKQRSEKEREAELESLRTGNAALTARVRSLEERAQQHDTEHVSIASDLVRTKVENDRLQDENEGLMTQVAELKKVVDAQPAEVEEKLKAEMDRIMQRNIEVQNQNRALEDAVQEMEQELVGTKMMFAQLNVEHDGLKQKLANIQTLLHDKN